MFYRKIFEEIKTWKDRANGRTALLIEGARRVGKSTIARFFAEKHYKSFAVIDFSNCAPEMRSLFDDLTDLNYFYLRVQFLCGVRLFPRESAIIFDEIQLCPKARQAIKHLVADGRFDFIETGSLISIKKNVRGILIPSEEQRIKMYPMDFDEFCMALGKDYLPGMLEESLFNQAPLGDDIVRKIQRDFRLYLMIGGMPQAIQEYLNSNDLGAVDQVKREIINLYEEDFKKIDPTGRLGLLFDNIPGQLGSGSTRYKVGSVLPSSRPSGILEEVGELADSMTVNVSYHCSDPSVGFSLHSSLSQFKLFLGDTGLFTTLAFKDGDYTENEIYKKLVAEKMKNVNLGYLYENACSQILTANGYKLFYYTFSNPEKTGNYEIDFLISNGPKIYPLEVKASGYKRHASLDLFCKKYSARIGFPILVYTKDLRKEGSLLELPMFLLPYLKKYLKSLENKGPERWPKN